MISESPDCLVAYKHGIRFAIPVDKKASTSAGVARGKK